MRLQDNKSKKTIKIAGAGISGITAAINLAKAGYDIELFEKNDQIGQRFHNDFQGLENWSSSQDVLKMLQDINIPTDFATTPANDYEVWGANNYRRKICEERPAFYIIKRGTDKESLDTCLAEEIAKHPNIKLHTKTAIINMENIDIVATGPYLNDPVKDVVAVGYKFQTSHPNRVALILNDKLAPDGYSYLLIANGAGVITSCSFNNFSQTPVYAKNSLKLIQNEGVETKNLTPYSGVGNFFIPNKSLSKIYVGEAAGLQDFFFFFGMRYAFLSGYFAACSIIDNLSYYDLLKTYLLPQMKVSVINRHIYKYFNNTIYKLLIKSFSSVKNPAELLGTFYKGEHLVYKLYPIIKYFERPHIRDPR